MTTVQKWTCQKERIAACAILSLALIAGGALTSIGAKSAFAQSDNQTQTQQNAQVPALTSTANLEQYILIEQPQISPLVTSALSPANVTLPRDLSDIVSLGSQLAAKEFATASNYQSNGNSIAAVRFAQAGTEVDRHLLQLVSQYEWDAKLNKDARFAADVARISYIISDIQRKETRIYEITRAAQSGNVTLPDMSGVQSKVSDAKQDVQNAISSISDQKQLMKNIEDAEKKMQSAERELSAIWKNLRQQLEKAGGEHRLDNIISVLNKKVSSLETQANKQGNQDALSEISSARANIDNASQAIASGDLKLATQFLKDAKIHLSAAQSLLG
jgi:hypothetical protein